jgi:hypothetical protein
MTWGSHILEALKYRDYSFVVYSGQGFMMSVPFCVILYWWWWTVSINNTVYWCHNRISVVVKQRNNLLFAFIFINIFEAWNHNQMAGLNFWVSCSDTFTKQLQKLNISFLMFFCVSGYQQRTPWLPMGPVSWNFILRTCTISCQENSVRFQLENYKVFFCSSQHNNLYCILDT